MAEGQPAEESDEIERRGDSDYPDDNDVAADAVSEAPAAEAVRTTGQVGSGEPANGGGPPAGGVAGLVAALSDRAIQRVTGGNAFLRGRIYARRNAVEGLASEEGKLVGRIAVRTAEQPYQIEAQLGDDGKIVSHCTCPGWRGPKGHCKHVAALLVAFRDRERPRRKPDAAPNGAASFNRAMPVHVPQTVSVGGKRRRSRRRRGRMGLIEAGKLEVFSVRDYGAGPGAAPGTSSLDRGLLEAWLPGDAVSRPYDFEYRILVRPASIAVTPVLAGTRSAVPIVETLAVAGAVAQQERAVLRALARNVNRGTPATAELRSEDAAEMLSMLKGRRALLEPASMELRFSDEALKPRIELDLPTPKTVRVRVVFESKTQHRRFALSSGAWFEGTPGWYIDTTEGVARPVADEVTPSWLQRLYRSPALVHPVTDLPRLLSEFVPRVAASLGSELPVLSTVADLEDAEPHFALTATGDLVEARARLRVTYGETEFDVPPEGFASPLAVLSPRDDSPRPRVVRRDVGTEVAGIQALSEMGFEVDESGTELVAFGDDAIRFWTEGVGTLPEAWDRYIPDDLVDVTIRHDTVTPQLRISSGVDWLSLDMVFDAGGIVVDPDELRLCLEQGRHLVKLKDGTYAPVQADQVGELLERMAEIVATSGPGKKIPLSQAGRVQDLLRLVSKAAVAPTAKKLFEMLANVDGVEPIAKPRLLKATLRGYQKHGFSWLVFLHNLGTGGILADDMGLGKTLQAIALIAWAKSKNKEHKTNLVVAPTSVVPNWEREIEKFAPSLKTVIWQGPGRHKKGDELVDADVMITSYALLRRDEEFLQQTTFQYAILDEAQNIKNPLSQTARAAKKLQCERRLALTGTPIENRLSEFWSIIDFVSPGLLGDLRSFEEKVARPIERGDEAVKTKLRATIQPFVLRRTKAQVAPELPAKIEQDMVVPLSEEQSNLYKQILKQVRQSVMSEVEKQGVQKVQIQILAALTRLRQVACDPRLLKLNTEWTDEQSGKLEALREILSEAVSGGHRVLVFSQFVEMLKLVRAALERDAIAYEYLDGSTKDRMERVDRFNGDESLSAFLISLKAGGTGLNLTGADTVIHFDPWWNPAVEDQATDRAHRIGQSKVVTVYRLIARGTVEEKIMQLSGKKRELVASVLSTADGGVLKGLTKADIDDLFSE